MSHDIPLSHDLQNQQQLQVIRLINVCKHYYTISHKERIVRIINKKWPIIGTSS